MDDPAGTLLLPARLAEVRRSGLLDTGPEEPFDRLTRLACEVLGAPFGFVTVVDETRSFWKSCIGVAGPDRQNAVEESFCQYVIATDDAVIIEDARLNPMTWANPSIESMGVIAWAGYPVRAPNGQILGTFCVVDNQPRQWTGQDRRTLETLAHAASGEVGLRIAADEARAEADRYQLLARTMQETLLPEYLPAIDGLDVTVDQKITGRDVPSVFCDAVRTPTGWALFAGQAVGSGVRAGRTAVLAKHVLRAAAEKTTSPAIVLTDLNDALHRRPDGSPLLVNVAYVAVRDGSIARICTAGTASASIVQADGTLRQLPPTSGPLGRLDRLSLKVEDVALQAGDQLRLATAAEPDGDSITVTLRVQVDSPPA